MLFSPITRHNWIFTTLFIVFGGGILHAQTNAVSPLTVFGIGDLSDGYFAQNVGIGGNSIALREPLYINIANPASYSALEYTTLEIGVSHSFIEQTVNGTDQRLVNQRTLFQYFSLGFRATDWWGFSATLSPYSLVGYSIFTTGYDDEFGDILYTFEGDGGINQVVIGNGFEPFKGFSIGANLRYLFGSYDRSSSVLFENSAFYNSKKLTSTGVSSFTADFGAQYVYALSNKYDFTVGATYANQMDLKAQQNALTYSYVISNSGLEFPIDTTSALLNQGGTIRLPASFGIGFSIGAKNEDMLGKSWLISGEFKTSQWSKYKDFEGQNQGETDSWRASVGGYFTPYFAFNRKKRSRSYLAQIQYRFGAFYEGTQVTINNAQVTNYGGTFGMGFPFSLRNPAPGEKKSTVLNLGIVVGNRGNGQLNQINERYVNLVFGITLGDKWFQKFKYR